MPYVCISVCRSILYVHPYIIIVHYMSLFLYLYHIHTHCQGSMHLNDDSTSHLSIPVASHMILSPEMRCRQGTCDDRLTPS